ncbi:MAG: DUF3459 domain-containing protein, partial [Jatrophihabitantaceae bacterium]
YREALRVRRATPALGDGALSWLDTPPHVLAFTREPGFGALVNFGPEPAVLPRGASVLVASGPLDGDGRVPADVAVWFTR